VVRSYRKNAGLDWIGWIEMVLGRGLDVPSDVFTLLLAAVNHVRLYTT